MPRAVKGGNFTNGHLILYGPALALVVLEELKFQDDSYLNKVKFINTDLQMVSNVEELIQLLSHKHEYMQYAYVKYHLY